MSSFITITKISNKMIDHQICVSVKKKFRKGKRSRDCNEEIKLPIVIDNLLESVLIYKNLL